MNNVIEINGTKENIWIYEGAKISWIIDILSVLKYQLELDRSCLITFPIFNVPHYVDSVIQGLNNNIDDFHENFKLENRGTTVLITRIDTKETYRVDAFKD
jgi:hypothetical protein